MMKLRPFDLKDVRLDGGPLKSAQEKNAEYLLQLDPLRLLINFRRNAGLEAPGEPYGGWEAPACEVRGHFAGHYLSACALMFAGSGDDRFKSRGDAMVQQLAECQEALGGGYLSAYPEGFFDRLESLKDLPWAPYYVIHKIMAGLFDQHLHCGNAKALDVLQGMAGWLKKRSDKFSREEFGTILDLTEEGGICETLWNLFSITQDPGHRMLAEKFEKRSFLDPLAKGVDNLAGRHANTHIPLVVAAMRRYEITGEKRYLDLASFFWDRVVTARSFATGGSTDAEHWGQPYLLARTLSTSNHETCKTFNMLRLTRHLFCCTADPAYADFYERAFLNGILGTQEPASGMLEYYVPQAAGYQRVFGTPFDSFWCCYGTGIESFAKLGDSIYFHDEEGVYVNLFVPSSVVWSEKGVRVEQQTCFPKEPKTTLLVHAGKPTRFALSVRVPNWADQGIGVRLNGTALEAQTHPSSYFRLEREWNEGDRLEIEMPMRLNTSPMPDDPNLVAYSYGPVVLAGVVDERPTRGPLFASNPNPPQPEAEAARKICVLNADTPRDTSLLTPEEGQPLHFKTVSQATQVIFKPFSEIVGERYSLYWMVLPHGSERLKDIGKANALFANPLPGEVDRVEISDETSEREHNLQLEMSVTGVHLGRSWRHAEGWWSWDLKVPSDAPAKLRCVYWGADAGRVFDVLVQNQVIATEPLDGKRAEGFFSVDYPLPQEITQNRDRITVTFRKKEGYAGGVFGCAVVR